jgi:hypothetical protein
MAKITLNDVGSLIDATTAQNTINTNNAAITTAVNNTLSRDGTAPNEMEASLDMNSNRILNLPAPLSMDEPVRLQDINDFAAGGIVEIANNTVLGNFSGATAIPTGQVTTGSGSVVRAISPTLTGAPLSSTPANGDNSTKIATTAFVQNAITASTAGVSSIGTQVGALSLQGGNLSSSVIPVPRYDASQSLTFSQKEQLRKNTGTYGFVTAAQYGAVGDNSTDDTAAIQAMLDALEASPYLSGVLTGTSGTQFKTTATLNIGNGVSIRGNGVNTTIRPAFTGIVIKSKGTSTVNGQFHYIRDLTIYGKQSAITGITKANPAVVTTSSAHGLSNGDIVRLPNVRGMTQVAGNAYTVANVTSNTFQLSGVNSTSYGTYTAGGTVVYTNATGIDLRYASACRVENCYFAGLQTAVFMYTDSGTVGCYYNVVDKCTCNDSDVGFQTFTGANSNYILNCFCNSVRIPFSDNANANVFDNIKAELFGTAVQISSSSAFSYFNLSRAENVDSTGTVFSIASGATDTFIARNPYTQLVATILSNNGTRTIYEGKQIITDTISIPSVSAGASVDVLYSIPGARSTDSYTITPPTSIVSGLIAVPISTSSGVFVRVANVTGSATSAFGGTWTIHRFRSPQ